MNKYYQHFKTITKHKYYVTKLCFKCGLYKRGILHDLSKYSPVEFLNSAKYWTGTRSPIDNEKDEKGYSLAWLHHRGHNPHHWEYWIDNLGTHDNTPYKIPYEFAVEMVCDWIAASIVYGKGKVDFNKPYSVPYDYYKTQLSKRIFHPDTQELLERHLQYIANNGINLYCSFVKTLKNDIKRNKY